MRLAFGDFLLDLESRELRRAGETVHLPPKAFSLLELLVRRRPQAISKAELQDHIWPNLYVAEANLSGLVADLRAALDDDPRQPRYLRTVHGFGYAWSGEAAALGGLPTARGRAATTFRICMGRREVDLEEGENLLGREAGVGVWIEDANVSRRHARILVRNGSATIEDLGSKNGTFLRGERLTAAASLQDGDEIKMGSVTVRLRVIPDAGATLTCMEP